MALVEIVLVGVLLFLGGVAARYRFGTVPTRPVTKREEPDPLARLYRRTDGPRVRTCPSCGAANDAAYRYCRVCVGRLAA